MITIKNKSISQLMSCRNGFLLRLDSKAVMTVGEMYFDKTKLKINMDNVGRVGKDGSKKLLGLVLSSYISYITYRKLSFCVLLITSINSLHFLLQLRENKSCWKRSVRKCSSL